MSEVLFWCLIVSCFVTLICLLVLVYRFYRADSQTRRILRKLQKNEGLIMLHNDLQKMLKNYHE